MGNPYDKPTRVFLIGGQTNPLYRTYVDTTWMWLDPGETRKVRVMLESVLDPDKGRPDHVDPRDWDKFFRRPGDVGLTAFVEDPNDDPRHALWQLGGAQVQVVTGRATEFAGVDPGRNNVVGGVKAKDGRGEVDGGTVLVTLRTGQGKRGKTATVEAPLRNGKFGTEFEGKWDRMDLYYVPAADFGDCKDGPFKL